MKVYDYTPKNEDFKGNVKIEVPNFKERLTIAQNLGIKPEGELADQLKSVEEIMKLVEKHVTEVNITHKSGEAMKSIEDLGYFQEGAEIINEVGTIVIQGIPLGN